MKYQKKSSTAKEKSIDWVKGKMRINEKEENYKIDLIRKYNKDVLIMDEELMKKLEKALN